MSGRWSLAAAVVLSLSSSIPRALVAAGDRFDPRAHFPERSLLYVSVSDVSRLGEALATTLPGRIATHPRTRRAFAHLVDLLTKRLQAEWGPVREALGIELGDLPKRLPGEVALTVRSYFPPKLLELAVSVDPGAARERWLALLGRLGALIERQTGQPVGKRLVGGAPAVVWPGPTGPIYQVELGGSLLFVTSPDLLRDIVARYKGEKKGPSLGESDLLGELEGPLRLERPELRVAVNLEALRALVLPILGFQPGMEEVKQLVRVSGLTSVTSLGIALGVKEGGLECAAHLGTREGAGGLLEDLAGVLQPVKADDLAAALAKVPASASEIRACRFNPGPALAGIDRKLRAAVPELGARLDEAYDSLEEKSGISVTRDVFGLEPVTVVTVALPAPAGGLPDVLHIVRDEELKPYWELTGRLLAAMKGRRRSIESGAGSFEAIDFPEGLLGMGKAIDRLMESDGVNRPRGLAGLETIGIGFWLAATPLGMARAGAGGGWSVLSASSHSVERYVLGVWGAGASAAASPLGKRALEEIPGRGAAAVFRGGGGFVALYNHVLSLLEILGPALSEFGVDLALLPPGEAFLDHPRDGSAFLRGGPEGWTLHAHRPGASPIASQLLLSEIGFVSILAALVMPWVAGAPAKAMDVHSTNNLRHLHMAAFLYAQKTGHFPHDPAGPLAALQLLADSDAGKRLDPEVFVSLRLNGIPAPRGPDGRYVLHEPNVDYAIVPWRLKPTDRGILFYEKRPVGGSRMVVDTVGRVRNMPEAGFRARFEREKREFASRGN